MERIRDCMLAVFGNDGDIEDFVSTFKPFGELEVGVGDAWVNIDFVISLKRIKKFKKLLSEFFPKLHFKITAR